MTCELIVMVGLPGSGKSTMAHKECSEIVRNGGSAVVISRDDIRFSMLKEGDDYFKYEKQVFKEFVRQINEVMEAGIESVYVDATHLTVASRRKLLTHLKPDPRTALVFYVVDCPLDTCLSRNSKREGRKKVPDEVLASMAHNFQIPTTEEFKDTTYGFRRIVGKYVVNDFPR